MGLLNAGIGLATAIPGLGSAFGALASGVGGALGQAGGGVGHFLGSFMPGGESPFASPSLPNGQAGPTRSGWDFMMQGFGEAGQSFTSGLSGAWSNLMAPGQQQAANRQWALDMANRISQFGQPPQQQSQYPGWAPPWNNGMNYQLGNMFPAPLGLPAPSQGGPL